MKILALLWVVCGAIAVGAPIAAWRAHASAQHSAGFELARLRSIREKAGEIRRLRSSVETLPEAAAEDEGLATRIPHALASAGVPVASLSSLTPQSESVSLPGAGKVTKRRATVTLTPVTLPQLGAFLSAWRRAEPGWNVATIEVAPDGGSTTAPGADLPLRVSLTIESVTADTARGSS